MKFGGDVRGPMRNIYLDVPSLRGTLNFDGNRTGVGLGTPARLPVGAHSPTAGR